METVTFFIFLDSKITGDSDCRHEVKRHLLLARKAMTNLNSVFKKQRYHFDGKGLYSKNYGFSGSHVLMWELDHKERWVTKNWCFWTVMLEKILKSPLDNKEIKPVNPKGNQPWIFIGRTDTEDEDPVLWPPDAKNWLIGKNFDARKDWGKEEKRTTEDEMFGCCHWLSGHEFEQTSGDNEGQWSLCTAGHGVAKEAMSRTWLSDWTAATNTVKSSFRYRSVLQPWSHFHFVKSVFPQVRVTG